MTGLRAARLRAGLTAAKLAERLGVTETRLLLFESGDCAPPRSIVRKAAEILGADYAGLLAGKEEKEPAAGPQTRFFVEQRGDGRVVFDRGALPENGTPDDDAVGIATIRDISKGD